MVVCGRGKLGYLTSDLVEPEITHPKFDLSQAENSIVMAWLVNSMDEDVSSNYMYFRTTKEIWDDCKIMYSDAENNLQVFETKTQLKEIKQGHLSVTKYYADLKKLWQEIDLYEEIDPLCGDCSVKYKKKKQKERVYEFLAGLNNNLDEVKGRIISRSPFPSTEEAFVDIRREESQRRAILQKGDFQQSENMLC
ncbi:hypothetical protein LIER_10820 [Lithospermum erythrorhizon]|uniref:Retrotransposon gag domain-containing protein n=1 Tax=Lithospermum erythrorhizon TaxID=34254 RepID=A0AAV3PMG7_LITER